MGKKIIFLAASILISILIFVFRDKIGGFQGYGLFGLFVISIIGNATIILPAPVILGAFVAGAVFNPIAVSLVVALGATIGELTGYFAGYAGSDLMDKDAKLQKVKKWMDKFGLWTIFILAVIPNPLFDLAGIVAGATGLKVWKYMVIVFVGKLIKFGVVAYLGANSVVFLDKYI